MNKCENHRNRRSNRMGMKMLVLFTGINCLFILASCDALGTRISDVMFFESYNNSYTMMDGEEVVYYDMNQDELTQLYEIQNQMYQDYQSQMYQDYQSQMYQDYQSQPIQQDESQSYRYQTEKTDMYIDKTQMMKNLEEHQARFLDLTSSLYEDPVDDDYIP